MTLARLAAEIGAARIDGSPQCEITAVVHDSRRVEPGALFVALRGRQTDGARYVADALARGAAAVVMDEAHAAELLPLPAGATALVVEDETRALSGLAAAFFERPSRALRVVGVTGTNGKTTTTHLIAAILDAAGIPAGRIGTLGAHFGGSMWALDNTTPLADELQRTLAAMRDRGAKAVAMEVSSHALALGRVADVEFEIGAFTNLTRDHLDFHGSLDAYAQAKRGLFERSKHAVIGVDDPQGRIWARELRARNRSVLTFGTTADAGVRAESIEVGVEGSTFLVDGRQFAIGLSGRFNVSNALAALAVARVLGVDDALSAAALRAVVRVPGRMQRVAGDGFDVFIDYAHTPDALERVLLAAREFANARVLVVFGCGGDRDRGKRTEMGRLATIHADIAYVTSDNPRTEDPAAIVAEVARGASDLSRVRAIVDRRDAIRAAVAQARPHDVVVIAGKGHEGYQAFGDRVIRFDDVEEVNAALAARAEPAGRFDPEAWV